jgi:hypothetical protein
VRGSEAFVDALLNPKPVLRPKDLDPRALERPTHDLYAGRLAIAAYRRAASWTLVSTKSVTVRPYKAAACSMSIF